MPDVSARTRAFFQQHARAMVALFFAAILLTGLCTNQYGHAWDDVSEMNILRMALKEYAVLLEAETPEAQWLGQSSLPRISESIERDHGICAYYPLFWLLCRDDLTVYQQTLVWRGYTWALFTLGLFALYACARRMGMGRFMSCLGVLMLLLSPRFFAEGHYNNKDIPLMVFTLLLLWQAVRLMEKPTLGRGLCFALAAGFCAGTRVIGVAFCGLFGLMIIVYLLAQKRLNRHAVGVGCAALLCAIALYILLTPAFLADPIAFVEYTLKNAVGFSRWHGNVLFMGDVYETASIRPPRHYLPVMIGVTTPIWALALLAVGSVIIVLNATKARLSVLKNAPLLLAVTALLCWALPLAGGVAVRMLVYNGWRHLYFIYGPMVLCMVYGAARLWQWLRGRRVLRRLGAVALAVCLLVSAVGIAVNHPYQYAYCNALVPTENRAALFDLDYWNLSCASALKELLKQFEGPVRVAASDSRTDSGLDLATYYLDVKDRVQAVPLTDGPAYVLSNLGYASIAHFTPDETMTPVVTIRSYGADVTAIYAVTESEEP